MRIGNVSPARSLLEPRLNFGDRLDFSLRLGLALALAFLAACRPARGNSDASSPIEDVQENPSGRLRFAALGDTGMGNADQARVARGLAKVCAERGCDFVLLLGDNIYPTGVSSPEDAQFETKFEQPYAPIEAPFYVALGNHDYGANGGGTEFDKGAHEVAYSSRSTRWRMPAPHYRFRRGDVELFALDTNLMLFFRDEAQRRDVAEWLEASPARWKLAFGHHPYRSNGPHGNAGSYDGVPGLGLGVKRFMDEVVCGQVDFYLSGHDHSLQHLLEPCGSTELVVSGGGGAGITALSSTNAVHFARSSHGLTYFNIEGENLELSFHDADGNQLFSTSRTKAP